VSEVLPQHDKSPFHKAYQEVAETGEVRVVEEAFYDQDTFRQRRWFRVVAVPATGGDVAILVQNVTERRKAEEALRESHERLKKVLEVEAVGVMFWDLNTGRLVDANDTFLKLMGYNRSDVEAQELTWQKFTPPEYHEVSRAEIRKFMATGRVGPYEKEYFCKDGTRRWLLFAGSSLGNNQCVEFCVDIADRKKAEKALQESEERFRVAQELSPDGFLIFRPLRDNTGVITDFLWIYENDAAARMNDTNPREVSGKRVSEILPHHEQSPFHKAYTEVAETGEVRVVEEASYDQDTFQQRRWFRVAAVPTAGGDVAIIVQDMTERKQAQ
jgi:PAS domain S-box-containing protein